MTPGEWHGWKGREKSGTLHIGLLPGRKSVCLYLVRGSVLYVLAYFRDEQSARTALAWLDDFAEVGT